MLGDARRELRAVAASEQDAAGHGAAAAAGDEGPCLDCFQTATPVSVADLAKRRTVGRCSSRLSNSAASSSRCTPCRCGCAVEAIGALNLFRRSPGPLPAPDLALGQALADVATIGILQERAIRRGEVLNEQLQLALNSRVVIEQAKGVLAQHGGVSTDLAFERLRRYARSHDLKISVVARRVAEKEFDLVEILPPARPSRQ